MITRFTTKIVTRIAMTHSDTLRKVSSGLSRINEQCYMRSSHEMKRSFLAQLPIATAMTLILAAHVAYADHDAFSESDRVPSALLYTQNAGNCFENAPITAEAVELNGYISTIVFPGGGQFIVGEAGAVFPRLETNNAPSKIATVLGGRVNSGGNVGWQGYLDNFYARVYSANATNGYLSGSNYISEFKLGRPVDTNNNEVTTIADGDSTLPDLPTFAIIHPTNTNYRENRGYLLGFNLTTNSNEVNATTALIPQNVLDLMQNDPDGYVLTFHVKSEVSAAGGVRMAIQDAGFGQGPLKQAVFHNNSQVRTYPSDPNFFSYAIGLEIDGCIDDAMVLSLNWQGGDVVVTGSPSVEGASWVLERGGAGIPWVGILTNQAAGGSVQFVDPAPVLPGAWYRARFGPAQ